MSTFAPRLAGAGMLHQSGPSPTYFGHTSSLAFQSQRRAKFDSEVPLVHWRSGSGFGHIRVHETSDLGSKPWLM